eukprot:gene12463-16716_t
MIQVNSAANYFDITNNSNQQVTGTGRVSTNRRLSYMIIENAPKYLVDGVGNGSISFALQAVIEITKLNSFRISLIWQMITSHLRMIASLKVGNTRAISVAATHDLIVTSLSFLQNPGLLSTTISNLPYLDDDKPIVGSKPLNFSGQVLLSDEILLNYILPTFDTVFTARNIHRSKISRNGSTEIPDSITKDDYFRLLKLDLSSSLKLSQPDLLSALRSLSSVKYSDVRNDIMSGLENMIQGKGHIIDESGWAIIIELLSSVPASMSTESFLLEIYGAEDSSMPIPFDDEAVPSQVGDIPSRSSFLSSSPSKSSIPQYEWPREALATSFTCMKLIVDEFLDIVMKNSSLTKCLIEGLALFSSQVRDVNISLTSLEMLWKVTDSAITASLILKKTDGEMSAANFNQSVLSITLKRLFLLSTDDRPEIRHSALNTLFSAMCVHAMILSTNQWQAVFEKIVFPLFLVAEQRTISAERSNQVAMAPELKKGVKMSVHHSRDTAQKQWSETRVLALRGLSRVLKTCTKFLVQEIWYLEMWRNALEACHQTLLTAMSELEVAVSGLDVMFSMLKLLTVQGMSNNRAISNSNLLDNTKEINPKNEKNEKELSLDAMKSFEKIESNKQNLWKLTWVAIHDASFFACPSPELALAVGKSLYELFKSRIDHEFRYSDNIRVLLEIVVTLSRPRLLLTKDIEGDTIPAVKPNRVAEVQLQRVLMDLLKEIHPVDSMSASLHASALTEICFGFQYIQTLSPLSKEVMIMQPSLDKLRIEAGEFLLSTLDIGPDDIINDDSSTVSRTSLQSFSLLVINVMVFRRFVCDICNNSIQNRINNHNQMKEIQNSLNSPGSEPESRVESHRPNSLDKTNSMNSRTFFSAAFDMVMAVGSNHPNEYNEDNRLLQNESSKDRFSCFKLLNEMHLHRFSTHINHDILSNINNIDINHNMTRSIPLSHSIIITTQEQYNWQSCFILDIEIKLLVKAIQCFGKTVRSSHSQAPAAKSNKSHNINGSRPSLHGNSSKLDSEYLLWTNLVISISWLISPWKSNEINLGQVTHSLEDHHNKSSSPSPTLAPWKAKEMSLEVEILLNSALDAIPESMLHFIDCVTHSVGIGIFSAYQMLMLSSGSMGYVDHGFIEYYPNIWTAVRLLFLKLFSDKKISPIVSKRLLWSLLFITKQLCEVITLITPMHNSWSSGQSSLAAALTNS